jgi:hypothetical protein
MIQPPINVERGFWKRRSFEFIGGERINFWEEKRG